MAQYVAQKYRLAAERFVTVAARNVKQSNVLLVFFREQFEVQARL
jgi:hypothetical protein